MPGTAAHPHTLQITHMHPHTLIDHTHKRWHTICRCRVQSPQSRQHTHFCHLHSPMNESCPTYAWGIAVWTSGVTYEWVMSHISMSHVTHMKWVMSHVCMRNICRMNKWCQTYGCYTYKWMNESCYTYEWVNEWVMLHIWIDIWMSHVYPHEWVMSRVWMSHVTHMNESCHTYEWVMSHIWNESCHTTGWIMAHI